MEELTLFEEALIDYIQEWQKSGKDPKKNLEELRRDASELADDILDSIPCWQGVKPGPLAFENGLHKTPSGTALVHDGYFVMLEDLVERLPRTLTRLDALLSICKARK